LNDLLGEEKEIPLFKGNKSKTLENIEDSIPVSPETDRGG